MSLNRSVTYESEPYLRISFAYFPLAKQRKVRPRRQGATPFVKRQQKQPRRSTSPNPRQCKNPRTAGRCKSKNPARAYRGLWQATGKRRTKVRPTQPRNAQRPNHAHKKSGPKAAFLLNRTPITWGRAERAFP